jgi:4-hydroxybutyrate CoA-transferase
MKILSAEEAIQIVASNQNIFIHGAAATPFTLIEALLKRYEELRNINLYHIHTDGDASFCEEKYSSSFRSCSFFAGANVRSAIEAGRADYIPIFLSEIPLLFRRNIIQLDVALVQVSPPDHHGYCTLGTSVDIAKAAIETANFVIAEINPQMPHTHGDGAIHSSKIHFGVEVNRPLPSHPPKPLSQEDLRIGQFVAELVEDGATLQMGIGAIPDATLAALFHHRELGIHTEMFSDGVIPLVEQGIITNQHKKKHKDYIVTGFAVGSQKLYDFVHDNPLVRFLDIAYVNDTSVIRKNPKVTSINSAIEVDLTGQVCADSIGTTIYSGVGGQIDFVRGASLSEGGKSIIALPSITSKGESRITAFLKQGAGVVTTRAHVRYIVTEYGIADLYGQSIRERAKRLQSIAHPNHRENLAREAHYLFK